MNIARAPKTRCGTTRAACLYWCDIDDGEVYEWNAVSGEHRLLFPGAGNGRVRAAKRRLAYCCFSPAAPLASIQFRASSLCLKEDIVRDTGRFNDCIAAPNGELFAGHRRLAAKHARRAVSSRFERRARPRFVAAPPAPTVWAGRPTAPVCIGPIRPPKPCICSITTHRAAKFPTVASGCTRQLWCLMV